MLEGIKHIPEDCQYTLILEADTWLYKDTLIQKYTAKLSENKNAVWASADWYDKQYGLATDFAIIKTKYILDNPKLFDFELFPECHISNYLRDTDTGYIWIKENMPVHVPSYVPKYPYVNNSKEKKILRFPELPDGYTPCRVSEKKECRRKSIISMLSVKPIILRMKKYLSGYGNGLKCVSG
ncbi:MAG: hypothetical protein ACLVKO_11055 [Dysgonomonas sp.]